MWFHLALNENMLQNKTVYVRLYWQAVIITWSKIISKYYLLHKPLLENINVWLYIHQCLCWECIIKPYLTINLPSSIFQKNLVQQQNVYTNDLGTEYNSKSEPQKVSRTFWPSWPFSHLCDSMLECHYLFSSLNVWQHHTCKVQQPKSTN